MLRQCRLETLRRRSNSHDWPVAPLVPLVPLRPLMPDRPVVPVAPLMPVAPVRPVTPVRADAEVPETPLSCRQRKQGRLLAGTSELGSQAWHRRGTSRLTEPPPTEITHVVALPLQCGVCIAAAEWRQPSRGHACCGAICTGGVTKQRGFGYHDLHSSKKVWGDSMAGRMAASLMIDCKEFWIERT